MGVTWHSGRLYVAGGRMVWAFRGWNGKRFRHRSVVYRAPKRFSGFNGIAFGPDGRLYAGVTLPQADDHRRSHRPFGQSVISMRRDGRHVKVVARGLRQPYQLAFVKGMRNPFVTNLGQDGPPGVDPPDYIVHVRRGQDYGFPGCTWMQRKSCRGFARPFRLLPPHSSPMGIAAIGQTLYVALFGGMNGSGPEVVAMSARHRHGTIRPVLHGFVAPIVGLGAHHGSIYVGDLTGSVYSVRP
jgi:glucose/arabinose dehydrogenase